MGNQNLKANFILFSINVNKSWSWYRPIKSFSNIGPETFWNDKVACRTFLKILSEAFIVQYVSDGALPGTNQGWFCTRRFLDFLLVWEIKTKRGITSCRKALGNGNNQAVVHIVCCTIGDAHAGFIEFTYLIWTRQNCRHVLLPHDFDGRWFFHHNWNPLLNICTGFH